MKKYYQINLENIVWGRINNKTLLIKLPTFSDTDALRDHIWTILFKNNIVFELDHTAEEIWNMLIKQYRTQKIISKLSQKYPLCKKQLRSDLKKFINQLERNNIIT